MELPRTLTELAIWFGMQFPVLAVAAWYARWAVRLTERLHERHVADIRKGHESVLAEKDSRLRERDALIAELRAEIAEQRARRSRSKKPPEGGPP